MVRCYGARVSSTTGRSRLGRDGGGPGGIRSLLPLPRRRRTSPVSAGLEPAPGRSLRRDIEGLRAVAVVLVVLYHGHLLTVTGGYIGVDVFFVISGFLITTQLLGELRRSGRISLPRFYARRVKRLLPAAAVVAVATLAGSFLWLSPLRLGGIVRDVIATSFYALNYRLAVQSTDYLGSTAPPSPLQHYWSLAVEEQYYLIWPVLILAAALLWSRRRNRSDAKVELPRTRLAAPLVVLLLGSFLFALWLTHASAPWAYFSLPSRAWELAFGALVALYAERLAGLKPAIAAPLSWVGLAAICFAAMRLDDATPFPGYAALLPVGGATLVIAAGCASPRAGAEALLRISPLQLGGRLSYSWYLWHWPVLVLAPAALGHPLHTKSSVALIVASFVLAWATYHLVENPVRRQEGLARVPRRGLALGVSLSASTAVIALAAALVSPAAAGSGVRASVPSASDADFERAAASAVAAGLNTRAVPSNLTPALESVEGERGVDGSCQLDFSQTTSGSCTFGDTNGDDAIVLFGDSHAAQWFPALDAIAKHRHKRLVVLTKSACPSVDVRIYHDVLKRTYTECETWRNNELARIKSMHPSQVILASAVTTSNVARSGGDAFEAQWITGTTSIINELQSSGASVVWLSDTPRPNGNVPQCVSTHLKNAGVCMNAAAKAQEDHPRRTQSAQAAAAAGATVIDPTPWTCPGTVCPVIVGNLLVYRDDSHLTTEYVEWITPLLAAAIPAE